MVGAPSSGGGQPLHGTSAREFGGEDGVREARMRAFIHLYAPGLFSLPNSSL
jgi:hypothetical protein